MACHRYSQKATEDFFFVCLFTLHSKQIQFVSSFFGRIYGAPISFLVLTNPFFSSELRFVTFCLVYEQECLVLVWKQHFEPHQITQFSGLLSGFNFILVHFLELFFYLTRTMGIFFYNQFNILGTLLYVHIALFAQRVWDQSIKKYLIIIIGLLNLTQKPQKYKKRNLKKE